MKKLTATFCLLMAAVVLMGQVTYHGTFLGGLVDASTANLTNTTLYGSTTANGNTAIDGVLFANDGLAVEGVSFFGVPPLGGVATFDQGIYVQGGNLTNLATAGDDLLGRNAQGAEVHGTIANSDLPPNALTNGQLGTVTLHSGIGSPPGPDNHVLILGGTNESIVYSNGLHGVQFFITNNETSASVQINAASLLQLYAGSSGTLAGGSWQVLAPYTFIMGGGFYSAGNNLTQPTTIAGVSGANPFSFTNTVFYNIIVYVGGGTVTNIGVNGKFLSTSALSVSGIETFSLQPNEWITVGYSSAPLMTWKLQ